MRTVVDFIFEGSKIPVGSDCSHEINKCFLFGKKAMTNLDFMWKKQRHHLVDKGPYNQSYGFSSGDYWMYGCESWTIKKAEHWSIDTFRLWSWRTLESPLESKEIKPVNPKENKPRIFIGSTDAEAAAPIIWPSDWCEESTHWKRPWGWERLRAGGEGGGREWDGWMTSLTLWTWVLANSER